VNSALVLKSFVLYKPAEIGGDHLELTDGTKEEFNPDAIARLYKHDFDINIENIENFYIEEVFTYGVNYGTNGSPEGSMSVRFTCRLKGDITTFSTRINLRRYILVNLKDINMEDLISGRLDREEIDCFLLNANMSESQLAWLKLQ
jgi:hypothetical protein